MGFYIPTFIQKRILRYALSKFDVLDIDALGLESLDVAWGKRSTLELRDVALRQDKLAALLSLPDTTTIQDAKIRLLRLTIPADIHASGILFEAEGLHVSLAVHARDSASTRSRPRHKSERTTTRPREHSPLEGAESSQSHPEPGDSSRTHATANDTTEGLPTAADLAQSFVDTEPAEEKAQLRAAVANARKLDESQLSESLEVDGDEGYGTPLSLPGFVADFLQGIQARAEVRVRDVRIDVCLKLDLSAFSSLPPPREAFEDVRLRISLATLEVHPVTAEVKSESPRIDENLPSDPDLTPRGKRRIQMSGIQAIFLSDASILSFLAQFSGPPSPTATHVSSFKTMSRTNSVNDSSPTPASEGGRDTERFDSSFRPLEVLDRFSIEDTGREIRGTGNLEGPLTPMQNSLQDSLRSDLESDPDDDLMSMMSKSYHEAALENSRTSTQAAYDSPMLSLHGSFHPFEPSSSEDELFHSSPARPPHSVNIDSEGSSPSSDLYHSLPAERQATPSPGEDLTRSRIFSHEEASSMYQSAISQLATAEPRVPVQSVQTDSIDQPHLLITPANEDAGQSEVTNAVPEDNLSETPNQSVWETSSRPTAGHSFDPAPTVDSESDSQVAVKAGPAMSDAETFNPQLLGASKSEASIAKPFFTVDSVEIELDAPGYEERSSDKNINLQPTTNPRQTHVPGGFSTSTVSLAESSRTNVQQYSASTETTTKNLAHSPITRVAIGSSRFVFDMALIRIATMIWQQFNSHTSQQGSSGANASADPVPNLEMTLTQLSVQFVADLKEVLHDNGGASLATPQELDILLEVAIKRLEYTQSSSSSTLQRRLCVGTFTFGYQAEPIIAFDSSLKLRESVRDTLNPAGFDLIVDISSRPQRAAEVIIMTLPIHIQLNLMRLDDTFSWIGGLSGILELGSSVISNSTVTGSASPTSRRTKPGKRPRNVRFAGSRPSGPVLEPSTDKPPSKVTARIGGLAFDLVGSKSSIAVDSTAVKIARRGEAIRVTVDRLNVKGPILSGQEETAVSLETSLLKFVFLQSPQEDDLDRLLALLAPSHGHNESTGDIILETFLRQRRQGSILRVSIEKCSGQINRTSDLEHFSVLLTDLKKLAPVARYIPDDNRPGLLTLARIEKASLQIETNHALGLVDIHVERSEIGHVSLPSILLLGIGSITTRQGGKDLLGSVVDYGLGEGGHADNTNPPSVHIRLIGDELDPTLKIKLWNMRFEYHISTVLSLLGLHETASGEIVVTELVNSVATLTSEKLKPRPLSQPGGNNPESPRPMKLEISIWDSAIGLNPRDSQARGLLHLAAISFLGNLPDESSGNLDGTLMINKMSLLLVDSAENLTPLASNKEHHHEIEKLDHAQLTLLKSSGYVVVSEISTASVAVQMVSSRTEEPSSVEVTIRDDLIVVETCADSTQTLIAVLNGLQPPMPPKKDLKYRTEVIPVQDMLASLSGQDFAVQDDEDNDVDYSTTLEEPYMMDGDESTDLEYDSRFYIPTGDEDETGDFGTNSTASHSGTASEGAGERPIVPSFAGQLPLSSDSEALQFDESHFANTDAKAKSARQWNSKKNAYELVAQAGPTKYPFRLCLKEVHLIWNLFDGYDWQRTRDAISQAVAEVETKAADLQARRKRKSVSEEEEDEPIIEDFLFNSIYIGVGTNQNPRELARNINRNIDDLISEAESYATSSKRSMSSSPTRQGVSRVRKPRLRLQRSRHHKMTFELKGLNVEVLAMPPGLGETQSSVDVRVRDLDIFDHVPTSTWKKFATYMHDAGERESGTSMIHLEILNVKPVQDLDASEIIFKAHILPLRLHVDQDALDFLTRFFEFKDESAAPSDTVSEPPFIQRAEVNSVPIKLDFKPKRVDYAGLRSGRTTEFMNFMILDAADMVLRHVIIYGVSGFDRLGKTLNDIWMPDVKRNQLPGVLAGLAPVRPLVNVGAGVRDLVVIPMREYRKDGRVLRSIQKGAFAFAKTTTTELAKLGAKVAMGTHTALQSAEGALVARSPTSLSSPGTPNVPSEDADERATISPYAELPVGVVQGLRGAYRQLERDLLLARDAIVAMPGEVLESGSASGAARAIARGAPTVVLRPALGVTKAMGQALMGAATTMDVDERRRLEEKYKRH